MLKSSLRRDWKSEIPQVPNLCSRVPSPLQVYNNHVLIPICLLNKYVKISYFQSRNRDADIENKPVDTKEGTERV